MGRPERELDPGSGLIERFAHDLRQLRVAAGKPTYRIMGSRVGCSPSRLSEAAKGLRLPSLAATLDYVRACGMTDTAEWERRWHEINGQIPQNSQATREPEPSGSAMADEAHGQERRPRALWKVAAGIGTALALVTATAASIWTPGDAVPDMPTQCRSPIVEVRVPVSVQPCVQVTDGAVATSLDLRAVQAVDGAVAYVWLHDIESRVPLAKTLRACELGALTAGQASTCGPFPQQVPPGRYTTAVAVEPGPRQSAPPHWRSGATGTQSRQVNTRP
ncbi:helix-turn-helix domain-containing protein [Nonomuraea sp. NPDC047897]|uniref:helix-turn-helix domain-containing protein n=1 Tax=Nonomuraea sp. NPDC047897 TaxID=3364346 RepID=UPI003720BB37